MYVLLSTQKISSAVNENCAGEEFSFEWIAFLQNLTYPVLEKCTAVTKMHSSCSPLSSTVTYYHRDDSLSNLHTRCYYCKYPSAEQARMRHWSKSITLESRKGICSCHQNAYLCLELYSHLSLVLVGTQISFMLSL